MTTPDEVEQRPLKAELVLWRDRAVVAPPDMIAHVLTRDVPAVWFGAGELVRDWRHWVNDGPTRVMIERTARVAEAAGGKLPLGAYMQVTKTRSARMRLTLLVALGLVVAVLAASVSAWHWDAWQTIFGPVLTVALLAGGRYYRVKLLYWLVPFPIPAMALAGIEELRWQPAAGFVLLLGILAEERGRRMAKTAPGPGAPEEARPGVSFPKLWRTVADQFAVDKVTASHVHTRPIAIDGQEVGVAFGMTSLEEVTDKAVANVARLLNKGQRQVRWTLSAKSPVGELVIYFTDTLAADRPAPIRAFGSVHYESPFEVGRNDDGGLASLSVAYTHVLVLGDTGSGKSSVVRLVIDAVEDMPDAELYGIDLAGRSLLGAQHQRLGPERVAVGIEQLQAADRILDRLHAEAQRRNGLEGEDYDEDGVVDDRFLVDDKPGRRGIVLVIGEYTAFCRHPRLVNKLISLGDIARKCAISIVVETPDLSKNRLEDGRAIIDIAMVTIAMACPHNDVVQALGPSKVQAGWRPDLLQPESEGQRNDAGCGYVYGGGRNLPRITKFHSMDPKFASDRRKWRRPQRDRWYAETPAETSTEATAQPEVIDAEIVTDEDIAHEAAIRKAIDACGDRPGLPVAEADSHLTAALRGTVRSASLWFPGEGRTIRAYRREALVSALDGP